MDGNIRIAKELLKIAKSLTAADEKEQLAKKFEQLTLGGKDAAEVRKNDEAYAKLVDEWNRKFPEEMHPVPDKITLE